MIHSCRTNGSKVLDSGVPVGIGSPGRRIRLREPGCPGRGIEDFTDAFGRFVMRVPDGDWTVSVTMPSGRVYSVSQIIVSNGQITDEIGRDVPSLVITR